MLIPKHGTARETIGKHLEAFRTHDVDWRSGRTWAYVYDAGPEADAMAKEAFTAFISENALDPSAFPSMLALETQVVSMVAAHASAPDTVVGNFTSGGTESIFCAVKAARDWARATQPNITRPHIVLPHTAHASFQKAAHFLGLDVANVPVNPHTFQADPQQMAAAITPDTIMMVGSAVSYAHGVVDPIGELAAITRKHDLWLHVDGCIGGFALPFFRRFGVDFPDYDFRVDGVTSMSIDLHKYAFTPKNASVVLYRNKSYRKHAFFACANWSGYTVINTTVQSTKGGGPLAAAWAMLHFFGDDGYEALFRGCHEATLRVCEGINAIPDLRVLVQPHTNLLAFASDTINVFHLADEMKLRGWYIQPQLAFGDSPANIHLSINPKAAGWVDDFLKDLRECVDLARELPSGHLAEMIGALLDSSPDGQLPAELFEGMMGSLGIEGNTLPERMAGINEVLNTLPPKVREQLLVGFLNDLYVLPPG